MTPPITVLDQLPATARLVVFDPARAGDRSRDLVKEEELAAALAPTWGHGAPEAGEHPALYLDLGQALEGRDMLAVPTLAAVQRTSGSRCGRSTPPRATQSRWRGLDRLMAAGTAVGNRHGWRGRRRPGVVCWETRVLSCRAEPCSTRWSPPCFPSGSTAASCSPLDVAVLGEQEIAGRRRPTAVHSAALLRPAPTTATSPPATTWSITDMGSGGSREW